MQTELKRARAISYTRGHVFVLDRELLLERACECYALLKGQIERLGSAQ